MFVAVSAPGEVIVCTGVGITA